MKKILLLIALFTVNTGFGEEINIEDKLGTADGLLIMHPINENLVDALGTDKKVMNLPIKYFILFLE